MVPIALRMGCETVMDAFNTPDIEKFINDMVAEEVIPMIEEDQTELKQFAADILERFYNPFIKHMLKSIFASLAVEMGGPQLSDRQATTGSKHINWRSTNASRSPRMSLYSPKAVSNPTIRRSSWNISARTGIRRIWMLRFRKSSSESGIFTVDFSEVPASFRLLPATFATLRNSVWPLH